MCGLESDTIGGYNAMLNKQKGEPGEVIITTVLFDDRYEILHDRINLIGIKPLTNKEYYTRGTTALLDAIGKTINKIVNVQRNTKEDEQAENIVFVITTDGMENASREYSYEKVRKSIEYQKSKYGWEFIFLGANIDAVETAAKYGIGKDRTVNYCHDSVGVANSFEDIDYAVRGLRSSCAAVPQDWKMKTEVDYEKKRGK